MKITVYVPKDKEWLLKWVKEIEKIQKRSSSFIILEYLEKGLKKMAENSEDTLAG